MPSRKSFIATVSIAGSSLAATAIAPLSAAPTAEPSPSPSPSPHVAAISAASRERALAMRRFDPKLSDRDIETIARGIDDATTSAKALEKPTLTNGDEPATRFSVPNEAPRA